MTSYKMALRFPIFMSLPKINSSFLHTNNYAIQPDYSNLWTADEYSFFELNAS